MFGQRGKLGRATRVPAGSSDEFGYLFVVTYGRSGSTLLMGVLNSLPGYCIRGENHGVLYDLFRFQAKAVEARDMRSTKKPLPSTSPWYGMDEYPAELAVARMRSLVVDSLLRPRPGTRVTGFKEIRWWMPKPVEYLDFIDELFPTARYILNTRDLDAVARSSWHQKDPDARRKLAKVEERLRGTVAHRGDRGYHVHYDDYKDDPEALRGLFDWLGEEYDPKRVARVLSVPHSSSSRTGR